MALGNGSSEDKRRALYQYLQSDENLEATEAAMRVTRSKTDEALHTRQWLTIREMHEKKFSTSLACFKFMQIFPVHIYCPLCVHAFDFFLSCMRGIRPCIDPKGEDSGMRGAWRSAGP